VEEAASFDPTSVDIIFSTMDAGPAKELEPKYAKNYAGYQYRFGVSL